LYHRSQPKEKRDAMQDPAEPKTKSSGRGDTATATHFDFIKMAAEYYGEMNGWRRQDYE